jgi:serine protease Do
MDDHNKKDHDYSDFFRKPKDTEQEGGQEVNETPQSGRRTTYHYSYGPFKSSIESNKEQSQVTTVSSKEETADPSSSRSVYSYAPQQDEQRMQEGRYTYKQKSPIRSVFASFLAGAVIMGSFMFASDRMNLFTGQEQAMLADQETESYTNTSNGDSGVNNASMIELAGSNTIAEIVNTASPAVVKIETMVTRNGTGQNNRFNDDIFRYFFGDDYQSNPNQNQERRPAGMGSGFIFEKNGYILTNEHVLTGADEIYVTVEGYTEPFKAELLGSDYDLDLAVLKIDGEKAFATLPLGDSADLRPGDWVTAIGNPIGFDHTVSVGVISADEREISIPDEQGVRNYKHLLQTDASINPGNSGGPLLNLEGEVIGINTAVSAQAQGIGFAIPTSTIVEVLEQLKSNEAIPKPYIGVYLSDIDQTWQENLKLESSKGSLITQLEADSPASRAGLRPGDVIVKLNNTSIENTQQLIGKIQAAKIGEKINLEIIREGKMIETAIIIGDRNQQ